MNQRKLFVTLLIITVLSILLLLVVTRYTDQQFLNQL